jgi:uncharacterized protein (DUF1778 family)
MALPAKAEQARVDFRVPADVKMRFVEAAAYENGGDLSAFLVAAGLERAERVLGAQEILKIDESTRELLCSDAGARASKQGVAAAFEGRYALSAR